MRLHRFYVGDEIELKQSVWLNNAALLHQWVKVFRLAEGAEVVLFDGASHDRLYKIIKLEKSAAHLEHVTDFSRKLPGNNIYLFWSLLKKDKNDWVLQKCTELGVSHFVPLLAERSEKTGFTIERAQKIIIEAAEQCGRSDIPSVREPMLVETAIDDYKHKTMLLVCQQGEASQRDMPGPVGVLVGPEGGWSAKEQELFSKSELKHINLGTFTLRAETASVAAATKLL